jgi:hypothetical protein
VKVGDLVAWQKPRRRGERDAKTYGLVIGTDMMGQLGEKRLWLVVKWFNGKTERAPEWLLASRVKVISESR